MDRRDELLEHITDHVVRHGLIGLTLRPLAKAVGTSDRMLIYHFGSRDDLVSDVLDVSNQRAIAALGDLAPAATVRDGVNRLWNAYREEPLRPLLWLYYQAAATGLIGAEPYRTRTRAGNARWGEALRDYLRRSGAPDEDVERIARLVDWGLCGFHFDLATTDADELAGGVDDLAVAAERLAAPVG